MSQTLLQDKQTIIVAEDDPTTLLIITELLKKNGYNVVATKDGVEAITELEKSAPDVIVTDLNMPNLGGIELIRIVKSLPEFADIPVLILTAEDSNEILKNAFDLGATDYIRKPISEIELLARISSAMRLKSETDRRKQKERELEIKLIDLSNDLIAAGQVQRSLLPKNNVMIPGVEIAWHFRPSEAVGGDLLNFFTLNDHQLAFYLLDVSGHGVPSALFAVSINSMLLQNTRPGGLLTDHTGNARPPHEVVGELNNLFQMDLETQKYFTFTYAVLDIETQEVHFTQAGQTPTLYCDKQRCEFWHDGDMPVGLMPRVEFTTHVKQIQPGSRIYLHSDGIAEAFNQHEEQFGYDRLSQTIENAKKATLTESIDVVVESINSWIGNNSSQDDITLLGIELVSDIKTARITVKASYDAVRTLCETVKDVVLQVTNNHETAAWIELAIAEAGNNIVQHGYGFDTQGEIRLEARATEDYVEVCLIDFAPAYDPLQNQTNMDDWSLDDADEVSAGLGINIMSALMEDASYERINGMNRLTLRRALT